MQVEFGKKCELVSALPGPQTLQEQLGVILWGRGVRESSIRMEGPKMVAAHFMSRQEHEGTLGWDGNGASQTGLVSEIS